MRPVEFNPRREPKPLGKLPVEVRTQLLIIRFHDPRSRGQVVAAREHVRHLLGDEPCIADAECAHPFDYRCNENPKSHVHGSSSLVSPIS